MNPTLLLLAACLLLVACAADGHGAMTTAVPEDLKAADRAFAADTAARGLEGWLAWYAQDAARPVLGSAQGARGKAEIAAADGPLLGTPGLTLEWEPLGAGLFEGGELGYTTGPYRVVQRGDDGEKVLGTGSYVSIWTRTPEGWRVLLDTGAADTLSE